jgi:hypothetical protein
VLAIVLCALAFGGCLWMGKRSLGQGLIAVLTVGYLYGILRANLLTTFSHFIFDAGLLGLYLSQKWTSSGAKDPRALGIIQLWTAILIAWPMLLVMLPFQPWLVSLVGLRGAIFFIPVLLLGARLKEKDLLELSAGIAVLDVIAFGVAGAEYVLGVPRFFPFSPVTRIIYASGDITGGFFRIPSLFSSSAAYGGTMASTMPYLIGLWSAASTRYGRLLGITGIVAALLGILMSASRSSFILGCVMVLVMIFTTKMKGNSRLIFLVLIGLVGVVAMTNARFSRFKSLGDADAVAERIAGSVNRDFWEILAEYPMGNGLGGGGTSIPYFLEGQVRNPIGLENEYARIMCEQGVIGLLLWLAFLAWFVSRAGGAFRAGHWANSRRMAWCLAAFSCGTAFMGTGLLTAIPGTVLLLISMGWTATPMLAQSTQLRSAETRKTLLSRLQQSKPAYSR